MNNEPSDIYFQENSEFLDLDSEYALKKYDNHEIQKYIEYRLNSLKVDDKDTEFKIAQAKAKRREDENRRLLPSVLNEIIGSPNFGKALPVLKPKTFERETPVHIDSRNRDLKSYPSANDFFFFLGRVYRNVTKVRLLSSAVPNSDNVIKLSNNVITWINFEDVDLDFPVYSITLRTGYYNIGTLQAELDSQFKLVKRRNGTIESKHYFIVSLDITSDLATFISLNLQALENSPLQTTRGSNLITVTHLAHGFSNNDEVYVVGASNIAGISAALMLNNRKFVIQVTSVDTYVIQVNLLASDSISGGGNTIKVGKESPFQFLFGQYTNNPSLNLGFPLENSSVFVNTFNHPLTSKVLSIQGVNPGNPTSIVSNGHNLKVGDIIYIAGLSSIPALDNMVPQNQVMVTNIIDSDIFEIDLVIHSVDISSVSSSKLRTGIFTLSFDGDHGFNKISSIFNSGPNTVTITSLFNHNLQVGGQVTINLSDSSPVIDGTYSYIIINSTQFSITFTGGLSISGQNGFLGVEPYFYLYGVDNFDKYINIDVMVKKLFIRDFIDNSTISFIIPNIFMEIQSDFGGLDVHISSTVHGFRGRQTNADVNLQQAITLSGENYAFLCCDLLGTASSNGNVQDVFAKINLTVNPGEVVFDSFVSAPKVFDQPLAELERLHFQFKIYNGEYFDFNRLDYAVSLGVTELVDEYPQQSSSRPKNI